MKTNSTETLPCLTAATPAEIITQDFLASVFGGDRVFRGVKVKRGKNEVTDIDVLAISGNKAVIAQCKSKKLTLEARRGDGKVLRRDFIKAVQDAYDQAIKGKRALTESGYELIDENGEPIRMQVEVDDVYILCISGDHYPAAITQARAYLNRDDDVHPILLSIFDLDIITFYLKGSIRVPVLPETAFNQRRAFFRQLRDGPSGVPSEA